jgi:hypothetical protein
MLVLPVPPHLSVALHSAPFGALVLAFPVAVGTHDVGLVKAVVAFADAVKVRRTQGAGKGVTTDQSPPPPPLPPRDRCRWRMGCLWP